MLLLWLMWQPAVLDVQCAVDLDSLVGAELGNMQELRLRNCSQLADGNPLRSLSVCTELLTLDLEGSCGIKDLSTIGGFKKLRRLKINTSLSAEPVDCDSLGKLGTLQDLRLGGVHASTLPMLGRLAMLQILELDDCDAFSDVSQLRACAALRSLTLTSCTALADISMLPGLLSLDSLQISDSPRVVDISALGECSALRTLRLWRSAGVRNFESVGRLTALRDLTISGSTMTDISFLGSCLALVKLDLSNTSSLHTISADLRKCVNLTELTLSGCGQLTNIDALPSCTSLRTLDLGWCCRLTDIAAVGRCSALRTLDLSNHRISDTSHKDPPDPSDPSDA